jgi:hypothetical protein
LVVGSSALSILAFAVRYDVRGVWWSAHERRIDAMPRYLLSVHSVEGDQRKPPSAEEMQHNWQQLQLVEADMKSSGAWVFSGRLHDAHTATVVRAADGEILTTDGPFAEAREHLGGFYMIDANDLDVALGWAARVTRCIGVPIEVRPFADYADEPKV